MNPQVDPAQARAAARVTVFSFQNPGGIAQLVERQLCKLDVRGSSPLTSTPASYEAASSFPSPIRNTEISRKAAD